MIRNFPQRMERLKVRLAQQRLAMHLDKRGRTPAEQIRERRFQRLSPDQREIEIERWRRRVLVDPGDGPINLGECIRRARFARRESDLAQIDRSVRGVVSRLRAER